MLQTDLRDPIRRESRPAGRDGLRLVVVSNRLPFQFSRDAEGAWRAIPAGGGLVTALLPVLRNRGGVWIGWPGAPGDLHELATALSESGARAGYSFSAVELSAEEIHDFYLGFSNEIIWPLFHDMQALCNFDPRFWRTYCEVNRKYAAVIRGQSRPGDFIWVHDYHLMNVAVELRKMGEAAQLGFFLHIPFPAPDIFLTLPWRETLLRALLEYDLIGFQTLRDQRNFLRCARMLVDDFESEGRGQMVLARVGQREIRIGCFPISIDYRAFVQGAEAPAVARKGEELHQLLPDCKLILGIDRLDYTKGIPLRLKAFADLLTRYPALCQKVTLMQVVVPSREDIPEYQQLRLQIEQLVGHINSTLVRPGGWVPVCYEYRSLSRTELLAYYRAADIALITPLKDGMNLVAKEYCACSIEEDCVLVLSEFAGAASQLARGALLVNPHDIEAVADALHTAITMPPEERRSRMRRMRNSIRENDVFRWVDNFLRAAIATDLSAFPRPDGSSAETVSEFHGAD